MLRENNDKIEVFVAKNEPRNEIEKCIWMHAKKAENNSTYACILNVDVDERQQKHQLNK